MKKLVGIGRINLSPFLMEQPWPYDLGPGASAVASSNHLPPAQA